MKNILLGIFFLIAPTSFPLTANPPTSKDIDSLVYDTLTEWQIPGLALAIVHNGDEIKVAGYGVKRRGQTDSVDEKTLFQICSLTKAFTTASIGILVEKKLLEWEQPIQHYIPTFQLKDRYATSSMTLRDLLSGRTGLPGISKQEWRLWSQTDRTTDELIQRLKEVDPAYSFRSHFSYSNMAYVVASQVAEKTASCSWIKLCQQQLLNPLGMKRTYMSHTQLFQDSNVAAAHLNPTICKDAIPWGNHDNVIAATGMASCASDMARWLRYCLSEPPCMKESTKPQSLFEVSGFLDAISAPLWSVYAHDQAITTYGFGWMMYTLNNRVVLFHTGLGVGMQSILAIVPDEHLGIAILTNQAPQLGAACLLNTLLDHFLHIPATSWHQRAHLILFNIAKSVELQKQSLQAQGAATNPTLALHEYAGNYEHPAYGTLRVQAQNGKLELELFSHEKGQLEHIEKNKFEITNVPSAPRGPWIIDFKVSQDACKVEALEMPDLGIFNRK